MSTRTGLSKSRYTAFCQCPKNLWLKVFEPEKATKDPALEARFEQGNMVGDLAMQLFGDYVDVTTIDADNHLDLTAMVDKTQQEMANGTENICEASFARNGHYCAVDILRRNSDGWDIYEVKSSTYKGEKEDTPKHLLVYTRDIAYQRWLLEQCGLKVNGTYLVRLNKFYVRGKELDIQQLFHIKNMDALVADEYPKVPFNVTAALKALSGGEPAEPIALHCHEPYPCAFFEYCTQGIPKPNVFDLYRMNFQKKCELYNAGKISFADLVNEKLSEVQQLQVATYLNDTQLVTPEEIRVFLTKLNYPLYFLDFETMQYAVPEFEGTKPYQQIPFQYSLHWIEQEGGELKHEDFLGDSVNDPRRALAEKLCHDIPMGVCTTAYNKGFECGRIKELADAFPDLREHLLDIANHIVDLIEPFRKKMVYMPEMNGSFSIKHVLPALQPDLSYDDLEGTVHNGGEAMNLYPQIVRPGRTAAEIEADRKSLLEYCALDTQAMVKVWEKLMEMAER
jgi:hypothetical protein